MAAYAARRSAGPVIRSISPSSRFTRRYSAHSPSTAAASTARSLSFSTRPEKTAAAAAAPCKRTCLCSPTNHPGSFRCSLHKTGGGFQNNSPPPAAACGGSGVRLNMRRSAMKNSLVRIGTVEGDLMKRALAALIRPSSHHQRRRGDFRRRPSRLSVVSNAF
ncbi:uncharacterized protein LOC127264913 [Andrographis paniculata]|uniref:uncharacterized protein LOC127264913 n=1 Tax=Andrographis paniculata TaxID=175694 RepID=UPI0021E8A2BE|nr:uncharacterized protein LOC127264913 [Andrographis paniculata]